MFEFLSRVVSHRLTRGTVVLVLAPMSEDAFFALLRPIRRLYIYTKCIDGSYEVTFYISEFIHALFEKPEIIYEL